MMKMYPQWQEFGLEFVKCCYNCKHKPIFTCLHLKGKTVFTNTPNDAVCNKWENNK